MLSMTPGLHVTKRAGTCDRRAMTRNVSSNLLGERCLSAPDLAHARGHRVKGVRTRTRTCTAQHNGHLGDTPPVNPEPFPMYLAEASRDRRAQGLADHLITSGKQKQILDRGHFHPATPLTSHHAHAHARTHTHAHTHTRTLARARAHTHTRPSYSTATRGSTVP